ncbi:MAG: tRNA 2-thiouridine(34) synthase MnmA [Planctomycetaceae bacterium]|jgi:tRNA-specific 2-thiouridylase|nr:tRNA 2-thiouridine(34) synthase MnmA [Planctomycetaceae bacterium]
MSKSVLVAMSGGVDSSVAAVLLRERGYICRGATMKLLDDETGNICRYKNAECFNKNNNINNNINNNNNGASAGNNCNGGKDNNNGGDNVVRVGSRTCCSLFDIEDARSAAYSLDIPFNVFNFTEEFRVDVIERFVSSYFSGFTPNPCIECNRFMKFGKFFQRAIELGFDYIATGHYARVDRDLLTGRYLLKSGVDVIKDQSYVLYMTTQEQLSRTLFPLGELDKPAVREIAKRYNLSNANKVESQDICFVPDGDYASFIEKYSGAFSEAGDFVDNSGKRLGRHRGIIRYTIGQRKGLGIASTAPYYVCAKNIVDNTIVLGRESDLYAEYVEAENINLISYEKIEKPIRIKAKVRYRQNGEWGAVEQIDDDKLRLKFDNKQKAITTGQALVLYDGETVVGGGTITNVF